MNLQNDRLGLAKESIFSMISKTKDLQFKLNALSKLNLSIDNSQDNKIEENLEKKLDFLFNNLKVKKNSKKTAIAIQQAPSSDDQELLDFNNNIKKEIHFKLEKSTEFDEFNEFKLKSISFKNHLHTNSDDDDDLKNFVI